MRLCFVLVVTVACSVDPPDGTFRCDTDDDCPSGLQCGSDFLCARDASDAAVDAPGPDASLDARGVDAPGVDVPGVDAPGVDVPGMDAATDAGPPPTFVSVCVGREHSCAVDDGGTVWCWGSDAQGQLGDGTAGDESLRPQRVALADVDRVYCGAYHTCAVQTDDDGYCWGRGLEGQLGQGAAESSAVPVLIAGENHFRGMALGVGHSCAHLVGDSAACWGTNDEGQLGIDGLDGALEPESTVNSGVQKVVSGDAFSCVLQSGEPNLVCWGANRSGQLGDGTNDERSSPTSIDESGGLASPMDVAAGSEHVCALQGEFAWCWGANASGQLGNGGTDDENTPQTLSGSFNRFTSRVWAGGTSSFAVRMGSMRAWGGNGSGQLGNALTDDRLTATTPTLLSAEPDALVVGETHTCALADGVVSCWGGNAAGQLGNGTKTDSIDAVVLPFD